MSMPIVCFLLSIVSSDAEAYIGTLARDAVIESREQLWMISVRHVAAVHYSS